MVTSKQQVLVSSVLQEIGEQVAFAHVGVAQAVQGNTDNLQIAEELLLKAHRNVSVLNRTLREAGVIVPVKPKSVGDELTRLATLNTPDTRWLLSLLEQAQEVAERVDLSRGNAVDDDLPLLPGESRGTDLAESISALALRLRREVGGARSPHE